jgi:hypothetical protein
MADLKLMAEIAKIADKGALLLIFVVFIWMVYYYVTQIAPALRGLKETVHASQGVTEKLLEGNASAFHELSRSNDNVATALHLLTRTMEQQDGALEKHEQRSDYNFAVAINKVEENTKAMEGLRVDLAKHVSQCDARYGVRNQHP